MLILIRIIRHLSRYLLKFIPLNKSFIFSNFFYKLQGYNIHDSAIIYSSAEFLGDININIGQSSYVGHDVLITGGRANVHIGSNCDISDRVIICCGTHKISNLSQRRAGEGFGKDVHIGNGTWIGFGVCILPGVTIGDGCVIGAGSVVVNDIPSNSIAAGNPAKIIRYL